MKTLTLICSLICVVLIAQAQVAAPPDSIIKKVEDLKNVSAIKLIQDKYANGKMKSEGWAYLYQDGNKTKYVRLGHWKYYHRDGTLEFEDFMPVNDSLPIVEKYYDNEGTLVKERYVAQEFDKNNNLTYDSYIIVEYYPGGKVKSRAHYKNKKKSDTWKWFDEEGNIVNQKVYGIVE